MLALNIGIVVVKNAENPTMSGECSVIAAMNFVVLPSTFLSSMIMSRNLMPGWIQGVSSFNPVNWAVTAARDGFEGRAPGEIALSLGLLAGFALVCALLATRSFSRYRKAM